MRCRWVFPPVFVPSEGGNQDCIPCPPIRQSWERVHFGINIMEYKYDKATKRTLQAQNRQGQVDEIAKAQKAREIERGREGEGVLRRGEISEVGGGERRAKSNRTRDSNTSLQHFPQSTVGDTTRQVCFLPCECAGWTNWRRGLGDMR